MISKKPYEGINGALYAVRGTDANTVDCVSQIGRQWSYIYIFVEYKTEGIVNPCSQHGTNTELGD